MLYFAYGSNLNIEQMQFRCPGSIALGRAALPDHKLVFRRVADVTKAPGSVVYGGLWSLTKAHVASLDRFEGVKSGKYLKRELSVVSEGGREERALVYVMRGSPAVEVPSVAYYKRISVGYDDFDLDVAPLRAALASARKAPKRAQLQFGGASWGSRYGWAASF